MKHRSTKLHLGLLTLCGIGLIYQVADSRRLMPSIRIWQTMAIPIVCPADERLHQPPRDSIGGEIGIHGVPIGNDDLIDARRNWT